MLLTSPFTKAGNLLLLAAITARAVTADCDPLTSTSCDPDPALGGSISTDFTQGSSSYYDAYLSTDKISYSSTYGATLEISAKGDNPTVHSDFYIMFGHIEFVAQAAPGTGIVSSMVLISDDLDEIDIEWLGGDTTQVQSNYFSKGDTTTYDRGEYHSVNSPQTTMNTYAIDWTSDRVIWYVNGVAVRTLTNPGTGYYPQTPMQIRFGSWAGGDSDNAAGTIEWAGGVTDYSAGPFLYYVKSLSVQDYSTGTKYTYSDQSGNWSSIESTGGTINGNLDGSAGTVTTTSSSNSVSSSASDVSSTVSTSTSSTESTTVSTSSTESTTSVSSAIESTSSAVSSTEEPTSTSSIESTTSEVSSTATSTTSSSTIQSTTSIESHTSLTTSSTVEPTSSTAHSSTVESTSSSESSTTIASTTHTVTPTTSSEPSSTAIPVVPTTSFETTSVSSEQHNTTTTHFTSALSTLITSVHTTSTGANSTRPVSNTSTISSALQANSASAKCLNSLWVACSVFLASAIVF